MTATDKVKKSAGGYVGEGPERWKRAQVNAERNPESAAAKLYRKRCQLAHDVACAVRSQPFTLVIASSNDYTGDFNVDRRFHYCSAYCAALGLQLRVRDAWSEHDYVETLQAAEAGASQFLHGRTLSRDRSHVTTFSSAKPVRCRVCEKTIVPQAMRDKATVDEIEAATNGTTQFVLVDGRFVPVAELQVVDLSPREEGMLNTYSTPELRRAYVRDFGHRFDG